MLNHQILVLMVSFLIFLFIPDKEINRCIDIMNRDRETKTTYVFLKIEKESAGYFVLFLTHLVGGYIGGPPKC